MSGCEGIRIFSTSEGEAGIRELDEEEAGDDIIRTAQQINEDKRAARGDFDNL